MAQRETGRGGFASKFVDDVEQCFPGSVILRGNSAKTRGIPDNFILYGDRWAAFEIKASANATHQPLQDYYVDRLNKMSYATFVYPENVREVLDALQHALRA